MPVQATGVEGRTLMNDKKVMKCIYEAVFGKHYIYDKKTRYIKILGEHGSWHFAVI